MMTLQCDRERCWLRGGSTRLLSGLCTCDDAQERILSSVDPETQHLLGNHVAGSVWCGHERPLPQGRAAEQLRVLSWWKTGIDERRA